MVAKAKYTPIGDMISPETTFVQAALALDVAAQFAIETKNAAELNTTAALWIQMSRALLDIDGDEESGPPPNGVPLGFRIHTDKDDTDGRRIDAEEPESDTTPGEGSSGDDD